MIPAGANLNKDSLEEGSCRVAEKAVPWERNVISMMATKHSVPIPRQQTSAAGGLLIPIPIVKSIGMLIVGSILPQLRAVMPLMVAGGIQRGIGVEIWQINVG